MLDICVVGLGAIGAFYAHALDRSGKVQITAVCRSNYSTLHGEGMDIVSDSLGNTLAWKPYRVVSSVEEAADRQYLFVICAFKALPDVVSTPSLIGPLLSRTDTFVLIQNGIGIHLDLQQARPDAVIISACAWVDSTTKGRTIHQTGPNHLPVGFHDNGKVYLEQAEKACILLRDLLRAGGAGCEVVADINTARWKKILWNATFSTMCTVTRAPVADLLSSKALPVTLPTFKALMAELLMVAHRSGISESELSEDVANGVIEDCMDLYSDERLPNPSMFMPSMLVDLLAGRPMEVEPIVGGVLGVAREVGVATPRLDLIYTQLKVLQNRILSSSKRTE